MAEAGDVTIRLKIEMDHKSKRKAQRAICKGFDIPEHTIGLKSPFWRRWWQSWTRRP